MKPLSKAKLKLFAGLQSKKNRYRHRLFMVEGIKMVREAVSSGWEIDSLIIREDKLHEESFPESSFENLLIAEEKDFASLTNQQQSEGVLAIVRFPETSDIEISSAPIFLLEEIQDPGNLGTLIRTAAWFGFEQVICSKGCVDLWNPKVLRATMGGVFHTRVSYVDDLYVWAKNHQKSVIVAHMDGEELRNVAKDMSVGILIGNEANGVKQVWLEDDSVLKVAIPGGNGVESLNAAMTGAIFAYEWRR